MILLLLIISLIDISPQNEKIPTGPIPKLDRRQNQISLNSNPKLATIAYGYSSVQEHTLSMPLPSGTPLTLLMPYTFTGFASSMCLGGDGKYYVIEHYLIPPLPDPSLYEFNPIDGSFSLIGSITGLGTDTPSGITYNPADGSYYICSYNSFFSFDLNSRVATIIGSFGLTDGLMDDLCFDENGVCYAIAIGSALAYTIDITTGIPTLLGPLGYYAIYGHGMSYDFETHTIYISAYNHTPQTGQLRIMDPLTGNTTLVADWGYEQIAPFAIATNYGPPCPVGFPSNPYPTNGSINVSIMDRMLSWTNGTGTTASEVWFGIAGDVTKVYDGGVISSYLLDTLNYSTTYNWRIICKNDTCSTAGQYWSFLTGSDTTVIFYEPFNNLNCWTPTGPQGFDSWTISNTNNAGGSPSSELKFESHDLPFMGYSRLLSCPIVDDSYHYIIKLKHMVDLYAVSQAGWVGLGVTYDGGNTGQLIWQCPIEGNIGPEEIQTELYPESYPFQMILIYDGFSYCLYGWYVDDLQLIDDCMECFPPATPSNLLSFHYFNPRRVLIYWQDNSWNEEGFEVFRKNGFPSDTTQYQLIGSVSQNHQNFWDYNIIVDSTYTYCVLAYNQYGNSDTSTTTTITIPIPVELTSFSAISDGNDVVLNWSTATELNNHIFEIQRRTGNQEFYTIGYQEGHGTTTEPQNYTYTDKNLERGKYFYRLKQIDFLGTYQYSDEKEVDVTGILKFALEQNYPNPFNPSTKIKFEIPDQVRNDRNLVTLKVYDVLGNEVATLVNEEKPAGEYEVEFDASSLPSGVYFYHLKAGSFIETKKMIFLK